MPPKKRGRERDEDEEIFSSAVSLQGQGGFGAADAGSAAREEIACKEEAARQGIGPLRSYAPLCYLRAWQSYEAWCVCVPKAFRVKQVHERHTSKKKRGGAGDLAETLLGYVGLRNNWIAEGGGG